MSLLIWGLPCQCAHWLAMTIPSSILEVSSVRAVFVMMKLIKWALVLALIVGAFRLGEIARDQEKLTEEVIRLHVVANSDDVKDQELKLQVRDAVIELLEQAADQMPTKEEAYAYIESHLGDIADAANRVIEAAGFSDKIQVTLLQEEFNTRQYDTFTLPAGVYDSLRITIGEGEGQNWWCVVFPRLCLAGDGLEDTAAGAGFSDTLTDTIQQKEGYEVRFWIMDCLGKVANFLRAL